MNHPLVTVVTGFYNRSALLERTVNSILAQSFSDFQLVVFDDGSKDDTWAKLERYSDPRLIKIRHQPNIGFVAGMIDAIRKTSSKYVAVQGSGDVSLPTRLEKQVALLESNTQLGVAGCYYSNIVAEHNLRRPRQPDATGLALQGLMKGNIFSHGEVMFRRDVYEQVGGYAPEFKFCQDYDLWLRMIQQTQFGTVKEFLYDRYIQFADGVSYNPDKFVQQTRYFFMAQKLATLSPQEQQPLRARLQAGELEQLVDIHEPGMQKAVLSAALRLIAFGNIPQADDLTGKYLHAPLLRTSYKTIRSVFASPLGSPARWGLNRALGIRG